MRETIIYDSHRKKKFVALSLAALIFLLLFFSGVAFIYYFIGYEKDRGVIVWQDKLVHLTSMEKKAVDIWFGDNIKGIAAIADNATLQLYISRLLEGGPGLEKYSYNRYIRELLILKSSELDFNSDIDQRLSINRGLELQDGLVIVDPAGKFIAAGSAGFKLPNNIVDSVKAGRFDQGVGIEELLDRDNNSLRLGFVAPVYTPQANRRDPNVKPIAYVIGVKEAGKKLIDILSNSYLLTDYENILLLKKIDNSILYLIDLKDKPQLLTRIFALDMPRLAAAAAVKEPGRFQQKIDATGQEVLFYSDTLKYLPWVLVHKIDKEYALFESNAHAKFLYTTFSIIFLLLLCSIILVWRHGASVRYHRALAKMADINEELSAKNKLLKLITDNISNYMMIIDKDNRLVYGNKALANISGQADSAIVGKNLASVLGASAAKRLEHVLSGKPEQAQLITLDDEQGKILHASQVPLAGEDNEELSIVVATDISDALRAQKQKESIIQQAVSMLSTALERHDPYSAQHSARVKKIALAIGGELGLTENETFNLGLSASLANIGKFYVPAELLCKPGKLTDDEYNVVKSHILHTIDMLEDIQMDRDIIVSVSQSYERLDGSGYPHHLHGDDICLSARIIGVANTFAAMILPRAWRQAIAPRQVLDMLMQDPGYDRKIVVALSNFVENKGGAAFDS